MCTCNKNSFYIFEGGEYFQLFCGHCGSGIPLYKIPYTYDADPSYYNIYSWNTKNLAWAELEFHTIKAVEKYVHKQLCDINSSLNIEALNIREIISEKSEKDCYYYLENLKDAKNIQSEREKKCPICNGEWLLEKPLLECYDFKCDKCKLLSNIAYNIRNE